MDSRSRMKKSHLLVVLLLLFQSLNVYAFASPSTVPAFLWSPHHNQLQSDNVLNYQTISPKDLAKSVLSQGGWSDLLCSRKQSPQAVDVALVFVGRELESSHAFGNKHADSALVDLLKVSFMSSNFSVAFPYIAVSGEETMENLLVSEFMEDCGGDLRINNVAFSESCVVEGGNFLKLADLHSVQDHLLSRIEKGTDGQAHLVVFCYDGNKSVNQLDQQRPESEVILGLINSVEQSGAKYTVLYVSDPFRSIQYRTYRDLERFLLDSAVGNGSANHTGCDEVCKFKSSLLEGILVAIVLLLILISGLCCMMGIDTPTRFEAAHES